MTYREITQSLKLVLKKQGITYRQIGAAIGMSESGVKKLLTARDGSFERLAEICRYAGTSLTDLLTSKDQVMVDVSFTPRQQGFLIKNAEALRVYWRLVYERLPLAELEKQKGRNLFGILRQLDLHGLVRLMQGGQVRLPTLKAIRWVGDGPLIEHLYRDWSVRLVKKLAKPLNRENELFLIRYFKMTPRTYQEFLSAQMNLEKEYVRRAVYEMQTHPESVQHVRWVTAIDNQSFIESE
jgi:transcriptional regulator with XRE-family HTH domain